MSEPCSTSSAIDAGDEGIHECRQSRLTPLGKFVTRTNHPLVDAQQSAEVDAAAADHRVGYRIVDRRRIYLNAATALSALGGRMRRSYHDAPFSPHQAGAERNTAYADADGPAQSERHAQHHRAFHDGRQRDL